MADYSFIIDSSFKPFSMQEMLSPFIMYKDAYEKSEEKYIDLSEKADKFKYLADTLPETSKARQIYEGYANDLKAQAEDLAHNGLNMANRSALTALRNRYQGEIGRLVDADTRLKKAEELRMQMSAKDPSMLYTMENLGIDMFLDNNAPNLYGISGNDLYAKGAAAGKAASSRIFSSPAVQKLNRLYNDYVTTHGYSPETMSRFRRDLSAIPELQYAVMDIARANKVEQLEPGSANYNAGIQQIINGVIDGAIYQRKDDIQRNLDEPTWAEKQNVALQKESMNRQAAAQGLVWDSATGTYKYNGLENDPSYQRQKALLERKGELGIGKSGNSGSSSGKKSSNSKQTISKERVRIKWDGDDPSKDASLAKSPIVSQITDEEEYQGTPIRYDDLPQYAKDIVDVRLGEGGNPDFYEYYFKPYKSGFFNDDESVLEMVPVDIKDYRDSADFESLYGVGGIDSTEE